MPERSPNRIRRAALLGAGHIAIGAGSRSHLDAYRACPDLELVAAFDPDPSARDRAAAAGLRVYTDAAALLTAERPDIVSICSPPASHVGLVRVAIESGVAGVLLEKPIAPSVAEARELVPVLARSDAAVAVNYSRRFAPAIIRLQQALSDGAIGPIRLVQGLYSKGLMANGSHWLDLVRWLAGTFTIAAATRRVNDGRADDPTLDVELQFANGAAGTLRGADHRACDHFELDILGDAGRVRLLAFGDVIETSRVVESEQDPGYRQMRVLSTESGVLRHVTLHALRDLVESIETKRSPRCTVDDGIAAAAAVEAAFAMAGT